MPGNLFSWLNESKPPVGFSSYDYPEAGDVPTMGDPDMAELPSWEPVRPSTPNWQQTPAGGMDQEGILTLPDSNDGIAYQPQPDPRVVGKEGSVDAWDWTYEVVPVYAVPDELGGGEWVGDLQYAPSLAVYQPQIIRYTKIPRSGKMA